MHHGYVKKIDEWNYSSYNLFAGPASFHSDLAAFENPPVLIISEAVYIEVLDWFGGQKEFIHYHGRDIDLKSVFD